MALLLLLKQLLLLLYKPYSSTILLLLLLSIARSSNAVNQDYECDNGDDICFTLDHVLEIVKHNMSTSKEDILACCNETGAEFKEKVHSARDMILDKLSNIVEMSDMEEIPTILRNIDYKIDVASIVEVVNVLPTKKSLTDLRENSFSKEHSSAIKKVYQPLFSTIMDQITNSSSILHEDLNKIDEAITSLMTFQNNITNIMMESIDDLPTGESFQNINNEFSYIAREEDLQSTVEQIVNLSDKLQASFSGDSLKLSDLLTQEDGKALIPILSTIISQKDLEYLYTDVSLLSSENSINILFDKLAILAKRDELESMGIFIEDFSLIFRNDIKKVMEEMNGVANKEVVQILENSINALEVEVNAYQDQLYELTTIVRQLLEGIKAQDLLINDLDVHINKLSTSESLMNLKELLLATYSTTNTSLEYVEVQEVIRSSTPIKVTKPPINCVHKNEIEESMTDLHQDIDSVCKKPKLQDLVFNLESNIVKKIENMSMATPSKNNCQAPPSTSQLSSTYNIELEASPCTDSEFVGAPKNVDVCSAVVSRNLCSADPLMGYHCCRSCVKAKQIQEEGPHRYLRVPTKVNLNYNAVMWSMTLKKN